MTAIPKNVMQKFEDYCKKNGIEGKDRAAKLAQLEQWLERYMYEPGEAIGIIAAQSISEPATQMCTDYNEKVILKFKNKIKFTKIGELVDKAVEERSEIVNGYEIFDVPSNIELLTPSLNGDGDVEWKRITALCRCKSPESLLEVKTLSGRSVKATDSHSFVIKKNGKINSISGKELKIGDKLPVTEYVPDKISKSDIMWDEIIEIRRVKPSNEYVYDMTVEGNHTFALVNGLIVHNTMRSYTLASQSDRLSKVTQGLPRLIEIFDARKTFEKNMIIYLREQYNTKEKAKEIASRIKAMHVSDVIKYHSIDLIEMRIELDLENESYRESIKKIVDKYLKGCEISFRGTKVYVKPKKDDLKNLRKIRNKLLKFHIAGVKGIDDVVIVKEGDFWVIQTTGANLKKILLMEEVDPLRTKTNDVHQVYEILGIEAARNVVLNESRETLDEQGLDVDLRHLMLLADTVTFDGEVKAIGRYGVSGKKSSVLAKANFEETKRHLINASFYGETDRLEGVIENIMIGHIAPIGTGMIELAIDTEKMKAMRKK